MSVFKHDYRPMTGRLTPLGSRPLVLARYALHEAWSSKITIGLFVLSLLPCAGRTGDYLCGGQSDGAGADHARGPALTIGETFFLTCPGDAVLVCAGVGGVDRAAPGVV